MEWWAPSHQDEVDAAAAVLLASRHLRQVRKVLRRAGHVATPHLRDLIVPVREAFKEFHWVHLERNPFLQHVREHSPWLDKGVEDFGRLFDAALRLLATEARPTTKAGSMFHVFDFLLWDLEGRPATTEPTDEPGEAASSWSAGTQWPEDAVGVISLDDVGGHEEPQEQRAPPTVDEAALRSDAIEFVPAPEEDGNLAPLPWRSAPHTCNAGLLEGETLREFVRNFEGVLNGSPFQAPEDERSPLHANNISSDMRAMMDSLDYYTAHRDGRWTDALARLDEVQAQVDARPMDFDFADAIRCFIFLRKNMTYRSMARFHSAAPRQTRLDLLAQAHGALQQACWTVAASTVDDFLKAQLCLCLSQQLTAASALGLTEAAPPYNEALRWAEEACRILMDVKWYDEQARVRALICRRRVRAAKGRLCEIAGAEQQLRNLRIWASLTGHVLSNRTEAARLVDIIGIYDQAPPIEVKRGDRGKLINELHGLCAIEGDGALLPEQRREALRLIEAWRPMIPTGHA